jgi:hypothetical protein
MFSVPPVFGVPGFSAWKPFETVEPEPFPLPVPLGVLLGVELLHAAASTVTATALTMAPSARKRKCLTTCAPPKDLLGEVIREENRQATCRAGPVALRQLA